MQTTTPTTTIPAADWEAEKAQARAEQQARADDWSGWFHRPQPQTAPEFTRLILFPLAPGERTTGD